MPDPTFVNYSHPQDRTNRRNRRLVASYIGTHYRNRSRPAARKTSHERSPGISIGEGTSDEERQMSDQAQFHVQTFDLATTSSPSTRSASPAIAIGHDGRGLRTDPFDSYPIEFRACIPAAVDYCEYHSTQSCASLTT